MQSAQWPRSQQHRAIVTTIRIKPKPEISRDQVQNRAVHIIDLCSLRSSVGPLWESIGEAIRSRLGVVMGEQLSTTDCYQQLDDAHFMIATPGSCGDEGAIIAIRVACQFLKSLNGSCDLSNIRIETVDELTEDGVHATPLRLDRLAALVERAQVPDVTLPPHLRRSPPQQTDDGPRRTRQGLSVTHHFEPVWDARHEAITTYLCRPHEIIGGGATGKPLEIFELTPRERTDVEIQGLMTGARQLSAKVEIGDRFLLAVPISFDTLCSPHGRSEAVRVCRGLPAAYRQYLSFLMTDIPLGVSHSRLTDLSMVLRPFGRIAASVAAGCRNFNAYEGHGFSALALDLSLAGSDAENIRADIVYAAAASRNLKCAVIVLNVDTTETFNIAHAADCQFIHGAVVAPPRPEPRRMSRLGSECLMHQGAQPESELWF